MPIRFSQLKLPLLVFLSAIIVAVAGMFLLGKMNQIPEPQPTPTPSPSPAGENTSKWLTYRSEEFGFELKYPQGYEIQGIGRPGVLREGRESPPGYIHIANEDVSPARRILISTPSTRDGSRNPQATSIDDYKTDYELGSSYIAMIHSQEEFVINNILALKQNYSTGYWRDDPVRGRIFEATGEYDENRNYRYIFMNETGETFMLKSGNPAAKPNPTEGDARLSIELEELLDDIAQTFRFIGE